MSKKQLRKLLIGLSIAGLFSIVLVFAFAQPPFVTATVTRRGPIQNVRFTVYDAGIYPRQLRASPGVVAIVLEDRTHRSPSIVIERETSGSVPRVGEITFQQHQSRIRSEFGLGVGRYRLSGATNPAIQAELIIEQ